MSIETTKQDEDEIRGETGPHFMSPSDLRKQLANCSQSHIRRLVEAGMLPKPVMIGPNKIAWRTCEAMRALDQLPKKIQEAQEKRKLKRRGRKSAARMPAG